MRGVSPGRDMVLCRLTGCNLEHAGIIQGMSGSPIYIDGKLLGAVAFAWEFAKDPIAGVTPFQQMVQYVRASDKRIAAEAKDHEQGRAVPCGPVGRLGPVGDRRAGDRGALRRGAEPGRGRGAGRDAADRHAAGGVGLQSAGAGGPERAVPAARAWRRWPAGRRPSGSSARRGTSRSCRGRP